MPISIARFYSVQDVYNFIFRFKELKMSRIAHLFAVPLTLVSTDDLNINGKSNSNKTNGVESKDKVSATSMFLFFF